MWSVCLLPISIISIILGRFREVIVTNADGYISFFLNNKKAQLFGSQGQQRTIVLSIKLAELELFYNMTGEYPVLLLDDVLSELDDNRQMILMSHIENKVQTFLTTASIEGLKIHQLNNAEILYVQKGQVSKGDSA